MSFFGFGKKKEEQIEKPKKTGFIKSLFSQKKLDEQSLEDLADLLIMSDMGVRASSAIISRFSKQKVDKKASDEEIRQFLSSDIEEILKPCEQSFQITQDPHIVLMIGVNGAGKTTSIGKLASRFKHKKISLIAGDTFRAAAVEQLKAWGERNKVRVFSGEPGCNSAGLCYDGINAAIKEKDELVFIDTAGRLQNKSHLMEELKKISAVIKKIIPDAPHSVLLTIDATTGQNALEQVKVFKEIMNVSGLIVTKLDGTAKGGVLIAIAEETKTPIYYIGVGEKADDLIDFNAHDFAQSLLGL